MRLADYDSGHRFANASGQAGAFGQTNFGGGFGQSNNAFGQTQNNTGGGLFGQPATTSASGFGSTPATSGFGSGGGLFGNQNKPATGGLFGQTSSAGNGGSLFGTANNTTGGFGTGTNTTNSGSLFGNAAASGGGSSLFGQNNTQQQSKPLFGASTTGTTGGFGSGTNAFGSTTNNTTNSNTGGGLFGSGNQTTSAFGQPQQQNQASNPFGGFGQQNQNQSNTTSAFGGFGQNQQQEQKPGGLFGTQQTSTTGGGGGLFGNLGNNNNQQQPAGGGLFGNQQNNNQTSGNSLFGNKPAPTGSLFGTPATNTNNTGGGLFGGLNNNANQNQQNQQGTSLFGGTNQQQKPSLFGNTQTNSGGGMFGTQNNNQQQGGSSLFGNSTQQQQQPNGNLFGGSNNNQGSSLFGSQQQQQVQPNAFAPPMLNASLVDPGSAYGSPSIFSGLPPPPVSVGPLATPINVKAKQKKSTIFPHYKTPSAQSRMVTPQKRGGFGFSYSTYGTPGSASSNASTPGGLSSSLLYSSIGRGLGKSLSTSNLRRNFDSDGESILTPGAFSAGNSRYGGAGSLKRLTIDRSLRTDLFGDSGGSPAALPSPDKNDPSKQPSILKKKVSFDASTVGGNGELQDGDTINDINGGNSSDKENSATPSAEEQGFLRAPARGQRALGSKPNGTHHQPEMEQVPKGNELAIVHEDESSEPSGAPAIRKTAKTQEDPQPGDYWMQPSAAEINRMTQDEKRKVKNFAVGREGCGHVEFNAPVDLTLTALDDLYGDIVFIELRSITVYPDQTRKPAQGKGLNVPSTLYLENSWPRQRDRKTPLHEKTGPRFQKHVDRLRKVGGTEFVRYEKDTGIWVFKVPHFTTYGFDYDDDASEGESLHSRMEDEGLGSSMLSEPPDTPTPKARLDRNGPTPATAASAKSADTSVAESGAASSPDDTFQFRKKRFVAPGAFSAEMAVDEQDLGDGDQEMEEVISNNGSFLDERSASSPSESGEDEPSDDHLMSGALEEDRSILIRGEEDGVDMGTGIAMAGAFPDADNDDATEQFDYGTPAKPAFNGGGDWAEELQRTISPKKQDRTALRESQAHYMGDEEPYQGQAPTPKSIGKMLTHGELYRSIFGDEQARRGGRLAKKTQITEGRGIEV